MEKINSKRIKPLLRWAGGKSWILETLNSIIPKSYNNFHEPFVGGGSVFLNIPTKKKRIFISDANAELICFYKELQSNPSSLVEYIKRHKNDESYYYRLRAKAEFKTDIERAARFYYLNRFCFNGIYRVNQSGDFNVPYGYRNVDLISSVDFEAIHSKLKGVYISTCDFSRAIEDVKKGDLVFLDPPYTVAHNKNGFISYNQKIFSWQDQERLAQCIERINSINAYFIMTNAFHDSIKELYKGLGKQFEIERYSTIGAQISARNKISEIIITNCI